MIERSGAKIQPTGAHGTPIVPAFLDSNSIHIGWDCNASANFLNALPEAEAAEFEQLFGNGRGD
jgi:hypothetical protein